ncbi:hypothetical protein DFJ58DRAFT_733873 [Suillus subalutaceus]|uniref:uncharacterized protein n=1 Tax=Suillus subalutaceus TaxID=48586 RepID=UPI001B85F181|nr:uncharacterized protein DFJ58DRAFT_733873 [Suillus subalutaceus]KAG1838382.1 hypothetical protein DFJ58DRAFT_733873 [Suillus subalutaceus]
MTIPCCLYSSVTPPTISKALATHNLLEMLSFEDVLAFTSRASALKHDIMLPQLQTTPDNVLPDILPLSICEFLQLSTGLTMDTVLACWRAFKEIVWVMPSHHELAVEHERAFREHGQRLGLTSISLYPPHTHCTQSNCSITQSQAPLKKAKSRQVVLHILRGAIPTWSVHLICHTCNTIYMNNFCIAECRRWYYGGVPEYIQVADHHFVDWRLANLWVELHLKGHVSAQACANIYNSALSMREENKLGDAGWQFGFKLKNEHIWDAFIVLALTEDCARGVPLDVPNDGTQAHRFSAAMQAHNERIVREGQPELRHYCDTCMRTYWNDDGSVRKVQVVVTDGLSMGRPCCNIFRCRNPLANNRSRFCRQHLDEGLDKVCAIVDCDMPISPGWKACTLPAHQEMECLHGEKMRANFQAAKRLQKMHAAQPNDAMVAQQLSDALDLEFKDEWYTLDPTTQSMKLFTLNNLSSTGELDATCDGKSELGNCKLRAKFGRSRTHNEQIVIRPCGIIVARATMVAAEAISNVLHMVKTMFSLPGAQKPEHIMYDSNCNALREVQSRNDTWFDNVGMCVNAFHFQTKHKEGDDFCQTRCNPAHYPELLNADGSWFFNSSIAE